MKAFTDLYISLDSTTRTLAKVQALVRYFAQAPSADAAWAVYFLSGRRPRQVVPSRRLATWASEQAGICSWLFEECYHAVGDLAETIALVLPPPTSGDDRSLSDWVEQILLPLRDADESEQKRTLLAAWSRLDHWQRFVWNKLITGAFRVGVSAQLLTRGIAEVAGLDVQIVAHRLMGNWEPSAEFWDRLIAPHGGKEHHGRPYPFFLATPLDGAPDELGERTAWQAEWKWDGIRAQLVKRQGEVFLWSRGEELIGERFPELEQMGAALPDGLVLDGEILPWRRGSVMPFAHLQKRIGRKSLSTKILTEVPVLFLAYDLLERDGIDRRDEPLWQRRAWLEEIAHLAGLGDRLILSPIVEASSWEELAALREGSRARLVEGLMLKRLDSPYRVGRVRGDWWKWKIAPLTVDAVLVYAQRGSGKRASLYTDYTFAVWDQGELVPFAKAYSGLTDEEIREVDSFINKHTVEKFGPVRSVKPELVFELAFEGIQRSPRHRSGIAVRFPRILRWRHDKTVLEADTIERVRALIPRDSATTSESEEHRWTQGELFA
jgi:DNA ligase-1